MNPTLFIITYLGLGFITATIYRAIKEKKIPLIEWLIVIAVWWGLVLLAIAGAFVLLVIGIKDYLQKTTI